MTTRTRAAPTTKTMAVVELNAGDAATFRQLLTWARDNGFSLQQLTVGAVSAVVLDVGDAKRRAPRGAVTDEDASANLYREFGGKALEEAEEAAEDETVYEEDDEP